MSSLLPILAFLGVFALLLFFLGPRLFDKSGSGRTKSLVRGLYEKSEASAVRTDLIESDFFKASTKTTGLELLIEKIPFISDVPSLVKKSGTGINTPTLLIGMIVTAIFFAVVAKAFAFGIIGIIGAVFLGVIIPKKFIAFLVERRTEAFINLFPDAIDMIVRSVKSGHPLNSALKMIAENMDAPVSTEFKQIVDEIAYGRSLTEALYRLSERIDQTDISFFVVVLAVQQETGGNLAEVLSNLSGIIRKRKQLRLKIKALTSEGRFTAWILGSLPFFLMGVLTFTAPDYLTPLFHDERGRVILGISVGLVAGAMLLMRKVIKIDI